MKGNSIRGERGIVANDAGSNSKVKFLGARIKKENGNGETKATLRV